MEQFSTAAFTPEKRLEEWNRTVSRRFTAVDVDGRRNFNGTINSCNLGQASVLSIWGDAATIQTSSDGYRRSRAEARCAIAFQDRQETHYKIDGRDITVNEGEFIFLDLNSRFLGCAPKDDKRVAILHLPTPEILQRVPDALSRLGCKGNAASGGGAILRSLVQSCLQHSNESEIPALDDVVTDLLAMVLQGMGPDHNSVHLRDQIREEAIRLIDRNLKDPDLNTHYIADSLGVSPRYVQMIFADITQTPTGYIRSRRLERVRDTLMHSKGGKISDIALDFGFGDISRFNRAFKQRFGTAPSKVKRFVS